MYLRLFIEAHESMLLSSTSEIYDIEVGDDAAIISFIIAWIVFLICIIIPVLAVYYYWVHRNDFDPEAKFVFMEFFADVRNASLARLYMAAMLIRRTAFVFIVIFLIEAPRTFIYVLILSKLYLYTHNYSYSTCLYSYCVRNKTF